MWMQSLFMGVLTSCSSIGVDEVGALSELESQAAYLLLFL
jgi:hypothetical protein